MNILDKLIKNSQDLSSKQQVVAKYILDNWEKAPFESAMVIAKKLNMSQSSVIRTIKALGFEGVPQFQHALSDYIQRRLSTTDRVDLSAPMDGNGIENAVGITFSQAEENIRSALQNLALDDVRQLVSLIEKANRIYVIGMRSSASVAHFLGFNLNLLYHNTTILRSDDELFETLRGMTSNDIVIAFSFSRYSKNTIEAARYAQRFHGKIIGVTDSLSSPLAGLCDILFVLPVISHHFTNSFAAVITFCDVILRALLLTDRASHKEKFKSLEADFKKLGTFDVM